MNRCEEGQGDKAAPLYYYYYVGGVTVEGIQIGTGGRQNSSFCELHFYA